MEKHDLDVRHLEALCAARLIGRAIAFHPRLDSTMDEARRQAESGAPEGLVVIADDQVRGRGRFSRSWVSPPGANLIFSVLLRPRPEHLYFLNMAAALAICDTVTRFTNVHARLKWPNDVMVDGRKISGILIENSVRPDGSVDYAVLGIGLNVNFDPSTVPEIAGIATSIARLAGRPVSRTDVMGRLLGRLDDYYAAVLRGESLTPQWSARLETLGKRIRVRYLDTGDADVEGLALAVTREGNLVLQKPDGSTTTVTAGEVTLQA